MTHCPDLACRNRARFGRWQTYTGRCDCRTRCTGLRASRAFHGIGGFLEGTFRGRLLGIIRTH